MIKKYVIFNSVLIFFFTCISGCTHSNDNNNKIATISVNSDSEYVNTFEDLQLGTLFDFDLNIFNADERWIDLWVEKYIDGEMESQPLVHLSYGNSVNEVDEGKVGFGIIKPNSEDAYAFLYGPGVKVGSAKMEQEPIDISMIAGQYAIGNEEVELQLGETKLLAAYRESERDSISTNDLQDEEVVNHMIEQDNMVLLLKIKIEETDEDFN